MKRILLGTITYQGKDYIFERWLQRVRELKLPSDVQLDVLVVDNSGDGGVYANKLRSNIILEVIHTERLEDTRKNLSRSRNILRREMISRDYDYLFMLESDVIPPREILVELLAHNVSVISGWYWIGQGRKLKRPCLVGRFKPIEEADKDDESFLEREMGKNKLLEISQGSMGCCLIKREVMENIVFITASGLGENQRRCHDDTFFFADCNVFGFKVYVDTDMLCNHFQSDWYKELMENRIVEMQLKTNTEEN